MSVHLHRSAARLTGRQDRYLVERVRLLYAQANIGILGSLFCALIVYFTLLPLGDGIALSVWIAAVLLVTLSRVWLVQCFRRSAKQASAVRAWRRHFVLLTACSGLAYGYVGRFLAALANIGILGSLLCALFFNCPLWPRVDGVALSVGIAAVLLVTLSRVWLVQCFRRSAKQASAVRAWRRHFVLLTACSGLAYGYVGLFLAADRPESIRLLIYLVLVSLTAGSVATYSAVLPVFLAFTLPVLASMFLHFALMAEQPINLVYAAIGRAHV